MKPRTLTDHESRYRYPQRWLTEHHPTLKLEELTADHIRQYIHHMLTKQALYDGLHRCKPTIPPKAGLRNREHTYPTFKCFLGSSTMKVTCKWSRFPRKAAKDQRGHNRRFQVLQLLAAR